MKENSYDGIDFEMVGIRNTENVWIVVKMNFGEPEYWRIEVNINHLKPNTSKKSIICNNIKNKSIFF